MINTKIGILKLKLLVSTNNIESGLSTRDTFSQHKKSLSLFSISETIISSLSNTLKPPVSIPNKHLAMMELGEFVTEQLKSDNPTKRTHRLENGEIYVGDFARHFIRTGNGIQL